MFGLMLVKNATQIYASHLQRVISLEYLVRINFKTLWAVSRYSYIA